MHPGFSSDPSSLCHAISRVGSPAVMMVSLSEDGRKGILEQTWSGSFHHQREEMTSGGDSENRVQVLVHGRNRLFAATVVDSRSTGKQRP